MQDTAEAPEPAILVAVQLPDVSDDEHAADLAELERLVHTLGHPVVGTVSQRREALAHGAVLGEGRLRELAALTGGSGSISPVVLQKNKARLRREVDEADDTDDADDPPNASSRDASELGDEGTAANRGDAAGVSASLVIVDHEITPSQARNLERATGARVLDRTGVIVEIFHRHAKSREAKLQVEIARLNYVAPRLRESPQKGEHQSGRGAGESALEIDKRKIRDRIAELKEQLEAVQKEQANRRSHRREARTVALVGYTNAGKSSLMRALTGSEVLVADRLFATLDTTVRALHPEVKPRVLVSDTVGFIKKLPHDLVASFRSTLDEALEASLLLHVVDGSDPTWRAELQVTRDVLAEIGADKVDTVIVFNKADRIDEREQKLLAREFDGSIVLSAREPNDVARLRQLILDHFASRMLEAELQIPYAQQRLVSEVHESAHVLSEEYGQDGVTLKIRAEPDVLERLRSRLGEAAAITTAVETSSTAG